MWRALRLVFGYIGLIIGGVVWFICFPLTAYTLYVADEFPLDYFGMHVYIGFPVEFFLPKEMWKEMSRAVQKMVETTPAMQQRRTKIRNRKGPTHNNYNNWGVQTPQLLKWDL